MKKLRLDLADIRVDAFETTTTLAKPGGTVRGAESNPTHQAPQCTWYPNTCVLQCFGSWYHTDCC